MSDIAFAFQIGGKSISQAEIEEGYMKEDIDYVVGAIWDQVGDLACSEHKEAPRFLCTGEDFNSVNVETFGCCDNLIKEVKKRMNPQACSRGV